jgi:hypothetical protein
MPPLHLAIVALLGLSSLAVAQALPPLKTSEPPNRQSITVRGCIRGRTLVETEGSFAPPGTNFRLRGSRSILASLKEHDGHDDEILGTTQIADDKKFKVTKEKKSGKTRVYGSTSAEDQNGSELPEDPWVDVASITHVSSTCAGK